jgi:20S proteasome alpha/beta subunit
MSTICIAVLCEKGKKVIAIADRMISGLDVEFEHEGRKIEILANNCIGLTAGSALVHREIFEPIKNKFKDQINPTINDLVETCKEYFYLLRNKRAEETYLKPLGLTLSYFLETQRNLAPDLVTRLILNLERASLDLEILIAGVDKDGGHIYFIFDPGRSEIYDALGFRAIGSGEHHAETFLIEKNYNISFSLKKALYLIYEAKKISEKAPGVGKLTDIVIIDHNGIKEVKKETLERLEELRKQKNSKEREVLNEIENEIEKLQI